MSSTIELPDPLLAEIQGYAARIATSPQVILQKAWEEYRSRHMVKRTIPEERTPEAKEAMLAKVQALRGSISLPEGISDLDLITESRMEKYGF